HVGLKIGNGLPVVAAGADEHDPGRGVVSEQPQQFAPRVARRPDDGHRKCHNTTPLTISPGPRSGSPFHARAATAPFALIPRPAAIDERDHYTCSCIKMQQRPPGSSAQRKNPRPLAVSVAPLLHRHRRMEPFAPRRATPVPASTRADCTPPRRRPPAAPRPHPEPAASPPAFHSPAPCAPRLR